MHTTYQQIQQVYNANLRNFNILQRCEKLLMTMLEQAVNSTYLAGIYSETQGLEIEMYKIYLHTCIKLMVGSTLPN